MQRWLKWSPCGKLYDNLYANGIITMSQHVKCLVNNNIAHKIKRNIQNIYSEESEYGVGIMPKM